jgi:hypothetical protein
VTRACPQREMHPMKIRSQVHFARGAAIFCYSNDVQDSNMRSTNIYFNQKTLENDSLGKLSMRRGGAGKTHAGFAGAKPHPCSSGAWREGAPAKPAEAEREDSVQRYKRVFVLHCIVCNHFRNKKSQTRLGAGRRREDGRHREPILRRRCAREDRRESGAYKGRTRACSRVMLPSKKREILI